MIEPVVILIMRWLLLLIALVHISTIVPLYGIVEPAF